MLIGKEAAVGLQRYITVILGVSFMGCYAVLSGKTYGGAGEVWCIHIHGIAWS
jgi:hypothetical protein